MVAPPVCGPMLSSRAHVHRRDRRRRHLHGSDRGRRVDRAGRRHQGAVRAAQREAAVLAGLRRSASPAATCGGSSTARPSAPTPSSSVGRARGDPDDRRLRDLIEIGRTKRNIPALFVPTFVRPKPVVERKHRFEVTERLAADGAVLVPLEPASVERALDAAAAAGAEALAVCFLHAYLNPAHERAVADAAKGRCPGCRVVLGRRGRRVPRVRALDDGAQRVSPAADGRYLAGLEERLRATGYAHGVLTVASSGGMMTTRRRAGCRSRRSSPVPRRRQPGVLRRRAAGVRDFITYDMGGTSTDVCLVRDPAPLTTSDGMLGAFPVKVPRPTCTRWAPAAVRSRGGPGRQPSGRPQRRRYAGPGRLRPRRHRADGDRRQRGARPNRNHPAPRAASRSTPSRASGARRPRHAARSTG